MAKPALKRYLTISLICANMRQSNGAKSESPNIEEVMSKIDDVAFVRFRDPDLAPIRRFLALYAWASRGLAPADFV
jgi:hypothetical protein